MATTFKYRFKTYMAKPNVQARMGNLIAFMMQLVMKTIRWRIIVPDESRVYAMGAKPSVPCFWHGRLFPMGAYWARRSPLAVIISNHRDGTLVATATRKLGVSVVEGSARKGGAKAGRDALAYLVEGCPVAVTPDGPKGPKYRAKPGAVWLGAQAHVPVIPLSFSVKWGLTLSSWDDFLLPLPFSKGVIEWGAPQFVENTDLKGATQKLTADLNNLTEKLDQQMGRK